jgi:hypothetical protein
MWFRKRSDPEALYIAKQCGIDDVFAMVVIPADAMEELRVNLFGVSKETMELLFEETTL